MQTLFLIYDEVFEPEITGIIERDMIVSRYSRIDNVVGARMVEWEEETGYAADRRNRLIILVAEPATMDRIVGNLRDLRARKKHGLRAFVVDVGSVI
jgi:hypothetical protein